MNTQDPASGWREIRDFAEIDALLHFGHWIPVSKGLTRDYVSSVYPGWTWNGLIAVLKAAAVVELPAPGAPLRCDRRMRRILFDSPQRFVVEWADGTKSGPLV